MKDGSVMPAFNDATEGMNMSATLINPFYLRALEGCASFK